MKHLTKHSIKTKKKIGKSIKKLFLEGKLKSPNYWKGKKLSSEHKEKIRKKLIGRVSPMKGKPQTEYQKSIMSGRNNPNWKGDKVSAIKGEISYEAVHIWVKKHKPKSNYCECCGSKKRLDISNISGKYIRDINDFWWICRSCHNRIDNISFKERGNINLKKLSKVKNKEESTRLSYMEIKELLLYISIFNLIFIE